jgi:hypothetical protein
VIDGQIEGRIEVTGRGARRRKQLLDDLKGEKGYWKLEEEALDRTLYRPLCKGVWTCRKTEYRIN